VIGLVIAVPASVRAQDAGVADAGVAAEVASPETAARDEVGREEAATSDGERERASERARASESESARASESASEGEGEESADSHLSATVFPRGHASDPDPNPDDLADLEAQELERPPPPEPPWRLRLGVGATAGSAGSASISLRLIQELEWMPPEVAPVLFALTGGEYFGDVIAGLAGARIGLYGQFCDDRLVKCTGAVALRGGVITGGYGTNVDIGGDADGRFRFDGVELTVRLGFWVIQGVTFVDLVGMVGAAF
jgi:hypothetical protein